MKLLSWFMIILFGVAVLAFSSYFLNFAFKHSDDKKARFEIIFYTILTIAIGYLAFGMLSLLLLSVFAKIFHLSDILTSIAMLLVIAFFATILAFQALKYAKKYFNKYLIRQRGENFPATRFGFLYVTLLLLVVFGATVSNLGHVLDLSVRSQPTLTTPSTPTNPLSGSNTSPTNSQGAATTSNLARLFSETFVKTLAESLAMFVIALFTAPLQRLATKLFNR